MQDTEAKISIIVPIFNVEKYLDRCISSIASQTYRNLEIILVDDGSPDNCFAICDRWAEKDSRITVIHKENQGLGFARNSGIDICTGKYIMFVDSDDYLNEDAVRILLERITLDDSDMVIGKHIDVFEDGSTNENYWKFNTDCIVTQEDFFHLMEEATLIPVSAWGKLYKREIYEHIRFNDMIAEDMWIFPDVVKQCKKISIEADIIYYYYQNSKSLMHQNNDRINLDIVAARLHTAKFMYENGYMKGAYNYYSLAVTRAFIIQGRTERLCMFKKYFDKKPEVCF